MTPKIAEQNPNLIIALDNLSELEAKQIIEQISKEV
jgi:orotidine-5'-phosphate decarboxylase